jgi:hypothetical protein
MLVAGRPLRHYDCSFLLPLDLHKDCDLGHKNDTRASAGLLGRLRQALGDRTEQGLLEHVPQCTSNEAIAEINAAIKEAGRDITKQRRIAAGRSDRPLLAEAQALVYFLPHVQQRVLAPEDKDQPGELVHWHLTIDDTDKISVIRGGSLGALFGPQLRAPAARADPGPDGGPTPAPAAAAGPVDPGEPPAPEPVPIKPRWPLPTRLLWRHKRGLDGNGFGGHQARCRTPDELQAFDRMVRDFRRDWLQALVMWLKAEPAAKHRLPKPKPDKAAEAGDAERLRLELLLWGGDEILLVLPAGLAPAALQHFYAACRSARERGGLSRPRGGENGAPNGGPLTHAGGLVLCHHKVPIARTRRLARQLAEDVKALDGGRAADLWDYLVSESVDAPHGEPAAFHRERYGPRADERRPLAPADPLLLHRHPHLRRPRAEPVHRRRQPGHQRRAAAHPRRAAHRPAGQPGPRAAARRLGHLRRRLRQSLPAGAHRRLAGTGSERRPQARQARRWLSATTLRPRLR